MTDIRRRPTREEVIHAVAESFHATGETITRDLVNAEVHFRESAADVGLDEASLIGLREAEVWWFLKHPRETVLFRPMVPGEFPPDVTADFVRVTKLDAAAVRRARQPGKYVGGQWVNWTTEKKP